MKFTIKNIVALLVLATCALFMADVEVSIWLGGTQIQSRFLLAPITRYIAQMISQADADWPAMWQRLYAVAFFLNFTIYAGAFWISNYSKKEISPRKKNVLLGVQIFSALIGFTPLFQLLAVEIAFRLPLRKAVQIMVLSAVLEFLVSMPYFFGLTGMLPAPTGFLYYLISGIIMDQFCFFGLGYTASLALKSRNELVAKNNELLATQQFLGEAIRSSERVRIARELHDSIGHNLTALNLHLDLATRQAGEVVPPSIQTARELGKELLADIRVAVSNERREQVIDLHQALQTLCSGIPVPKISLNIDSKLEVETPSIAHVIFRCTQESITNAVRHADASRINVSLLKDEHGISLNIEDNGKGLKDHKEGNGLRGIRERIELHNGSVEFIKKSSSGCHIHIHIPQEGAYA